MKKENTRLYSIIFIISLTIIICAIFFLFAYIQKISTAESATEKKVEGVELHYKEAEQHIQKQDSIIHILEEQVRSLQKSNP